MADELVQEYSQRIFDAAREGTPKNPAGLPEALALLVVAQAKHETGNFSSNGFRDGWNAFGYSFVAGATWQTARAGRIADNGQPLATYASIEDSTREIVDWIYRRLREGKFPPLAQVTTPEQYAALLKKAGYFGDTLNNYLTGLKRWLDVNIPGGSQGAAGILVAAALVAVLAWSLRS